MKNFKKIITSILACSLVFVCCFGLVGCDNATNDEKPETEQTQKNTPEAETEISKLSVEEAEMVYYEAVRNTLLKMERESTLVCYAANEKDGSISKSSESTLYLNKGYFYFSDVELIKDGRKYNEETKTYIELNTGMPIQTVEWTQLFINQIEENNINFVFGTNEGEVYKIYLSSELETNKKFNYTVEINNNLITKIDSTYITNNKISQIYAISTNYENIQFPRSTPTDLNTYTKAD